MDPYLASAGLDERLFALSALAPRSFVAIFD